MNCLVLSMSTLGINKVDGKYSPRAYQYCSPLVDGKEFSFLGLSQLEPGTKYLVNLLAEKGERLDRVVVLNTTETEKPIATTNWYIANVDNCSTLSAFDFYKNRIDAYLHQEEVNPEIKSQTQIVCSESSQLRGLYEGIKFCPISVVVSSDKESGEETYSALAEVIPKLCAQILEGSQPNDLRLFVDTQGGRRNTTFVINAAIELLCNRGAKLEKTIATDFNRDVEVQKIVDVTMNNRAFDLVAGMNEFLNFGRADKLNNYYNLYKKLYTNDTELAEGKIVEAVNQISDAVLMCDMDNFRTLLDELSKAIAEYEKGEFGQMPSDPMLGMLVGDLKADYGVLLEPHDVLAEITWCLKKMLYQQAITLCESKIPNYLSDKKLIYMDKGKYGGLLKELIKDKFPKDKHLLEDFDYSSVRLCFFSEDWKSKPSGECETVELYSPLEQEQLDELHEVYDRIRKLRNEANHVKSSKASRSGSDGEQRTTRTGQATKLIQRMLELLESAETITSSEGVSERCIVRKDVNLTDKTTAVKTILEPLRGMIGKEQATLSNPFLRKYVAALNMVSSPERIDALEDSIFGLYLGTELDTYNELQLLSALLKLSGGVSCKETMKKKSNYAVHILKQSIQNKKLANLIYEAYKKEEKRKKESE